MLVPVLGWLCAWWRQGAGAGAGAGCCQLAPACCQLAVRVETGCRCWLPVGCARGGDGASDRVRVLHAASWCWCWVLAVRVVETGCWCRCWVLPVGCGGDRVLVPVLGAASWLCAWWRQGAGAGCCQLAVCVVETGCWCRCWVLLFSR